MRLIVLLVFLIIIALLSALNPSFLTAPFTLNLGFVSYERVPMGLLMLLLLLLPMLIFYFWAGVTKLRAAADSAKLLKDIEGLRLSLDSQESSRFSKLQAYLDERLNALDSKSSGGTLDLSSVHTRLDTLEREVTLHLAQMDDYLKSKLGEAKK